MKLLSLLEKIDYEVIKGSPDIEVSEFITDSRKASAGCLFVCISGFKVDGHDFIKEVTEKGAAALIIEKDIDTSYLKNVTVIRVKDTRVAMAYVSAAYFGYPADKLKVIGVTGTKGKTTTTYFIKDMLERAGIKTGLIGTIEIIIGDEHISAQNTTPESYALQGYFRRMLDEGIRVVVMETASQGFKLHRTDGFTFEIGVFTNLSPDHIGPNEHESFEDYLECKARLFKQCRLGIINCDDEYALKIIKGHTCEIMTYGFNKEADIYAENPELIKKPNELGVSFDIKGNTELRAEVSAPGRFSIYNALASVAVCSHFNVSKEAMCDALKNASVKGRIEMVKTPYNFTLLIDYAHNAVSLESILTTLREYEPNRLICLFGCGGNRSRERRFSMGEVSGRLADLTVITSDNPRDEDPQAIIDDIKTGINKTSGRYVEIINRKEAIRYAIENGLPHDIIVLAGKGHEDYQEIKGVKYPMDERVLIREILAEKKR